MSVSEPFEPENLAGQLEYLIDNQDVYLVDSVVTVGPNELFMKLHSGDRFRIVITPQD